MKHATFTPANLVRFAPYNKPACACVYAYTTPSDEPLFPTLLHFSCLDDSADGIGQGSNHKPG